MARPRVDTLIRFLNGFVVNKETACWEWKWCKKGGYASIGIGRKLQIAVHRFSYLTYIGEEIPKGKFICHKCDNRRCCNPFHLFLGTPKDNHLDAQKKGRIKSQVCPSHYSYNNGCRCVLCVEYRDKYSKEYEAKNRDKINERNRKLSANKKLENILKE